MLPLFPRAPDAGHHRHRARWIERLHHLVADLLGRVLPDVDDLLVALVLGDEAALVLLVDRRRPVRRPASAAPAFSVGIGDVVDGDRHAAARGVVEADALDAVDEVGRLGRAEQPVAVADQLAQGRRGSWALFTKRSRSGRTWLKMTRPTVVRTGLLDDRRPSPRPSARTVWTSIGECSSKRWTRCGWSSSTSCRACRCGRRRRPAGPRSRRRSWAIGSLSCVSSRSMVR